MKKLSVGLLLVNAEFWQKIEAKGSEEFENIEVFSKSPWFWGRSFASPEYVTSIENEIEAEDKIEKDSIP
jgi:hypothetical protein